MVVRGTEVIIATIKSPAVWVNSGTLTTTAGRVLVAERSVNGKGNKTTSPLWYMVVFLPVIVDGVYLVVPVFAKAGDGPRSPISLLGQRFPGCLLLPLATQKLNKGSHQLRLLLR